MMKRLLAWMAILATVAGVGLVEATSAQAAPYCGITWGSLPKEGRLVGTSPTALPNTLTNVRAGRHDCYDRLVMDINGPSNGFSVRYVDAVTEQGRGNVIPLRGGAFLEIVLSNWAYDFDAGEPTYSPVDRSELVNVDGWPTFRQVAFDGSYEGHTLIGLGVRARLPFRVFSLAGPGSGSRVVVDVAHRW